MCELPGHCFAKGFSTTHDRLFRKARGFDMPIFKYDSIVSVICYPTSSDLLAFISFVIVDAYFFS
jgi:hypothetical protein